MKITIEIQVEETTAALVWANEWGDKEGLTAAEAIIRAMERIARLVPDAPVMSVSKMRLVESKRRRVDQIGTIRCGRGPACLDLRVMRRDQNKMEPQNQI